MDFGKCFRDARTKGKVPGQIFSFRQNIFFWWQPGLFNTIKYYEEGKRKKNLISVWKQTKKKNLGAESKTIPCLRQSLLLRGGVVVNQNDQHK